MAAVPKLSQEGGRLADTTAMDYRSYGSGQVTKARLFLFKGALRRPADLTTGLAFANGPSFRDK